MNPKVITTAAGIETLFQQAGAATVQAAILQPAETLLDLYGEDIRARAYVTSDPLRGEQMLRGLGTINPLANNVPDTWSSLINGESGIDTITAFDTSELPVSFAGEVKNFDANEYMGKQQARKLDKSSQLSIFATEEALKDANLNTDERLGPNVGIVFGTGIGGIGSTEQAVRTFDERGASRINPLAITQLMPNSSTGQVAIQ